MTMYHLDHRLAHDTVFVGKFTLCDVLLMNDARYPWIVLVPRCDQITEIFQLEPAEQQQLMIESSFVSRQLMALVDADKMNVAALGNVVSQLHIHHIARFKIDQTWPDPVWGRGQVVPYTNNELDAVCQQMQAILSELLDDGARSPF